METMEQISSCANLINQKINKRQLLKYKFLMNKSI